PSQLRGLLLPRRLRRLLLLHPVRIPHHLSALGRGEAVRRHPGPPLLPAPGLPHLAALFRRRPLRPLLLQRPPAPLWAPLPGRVRAGHRPPQLHAVPPQPDEQPLHGGRHPQPHLVDRHRGAVLPALGAGGEAGAGAAPRPLLGRARPLLRPLLSEPLQRLRPPRVEDVRRPIEVPLHGGGGPPWLGPPSQAAGPPPPPPPRPP